MPTSNNALNITTAGIPVFNGTSAFAATTTTQYNILSGSTANAINNIPPNATSGIPLISQGSSSQPTFGTAVIAGGGTGVTSVTTSPTASAWAGWDANKNFSANNHFLGFQQNTILGGSVALTNASAEYQHVGGTGGTLVLPDATTLPSPVGVGLSTQYYIDNDASGNVAVNTNNNGGGGGLLFTATPGTLYTVYLASNASAAGTWYFYASLPSLNLTQYDVLVGGAGNTISSVGPGTAGQVLQSGGGSANPAYSTATYPATAGTSGTVLTSNGTNFVNTSATYPSSTTANEILYSSASNTVSQITAADNGVLITSAAGVPSLLANGSTGQILTATTSNPPSWTTATYPSTTTANELLYSSATNVVGQVTAGTTGTVLIGTTSSVPSFSAYPQVSGLGVGASAGSTAGITFDGTNFLNHFVDWSTWTPTVNGDVSGTTTYTAQYGFYTRIGNIVFCQFQCSFSAATGTGNLTIGGLPFTVNSTSGYTALNGSAYVAGAITWPATTTMLMFDALPGTTTARIIGSQSSSGGSFLQMANTVVDIYGMMIYRI
jgi:hypothetical protein